MSGGPREHVSGSLQRGGGCTATGQLQENAEPVSDESEESGGDRH